MKKNLTILIAIMLCSASQVHAGFDGLSVGAGGGYTNYQSPTFEGFCQVNLKLGQVPFQPKLGIAYHSYTANFQSFKNLDIGSIGIFLEAAFFPARKYLFAGVRIDGNFGYYTNNYEVQQLKNTYPYPPYSIFGANFYGILGVDIPIKEWISFRLYVMPGLRFYDISNSNWELTFGGVKIDDSGSQNHDSQYDLGEASTSFVFQANAALVFRVYHRKK